eukprot:403331437
MMRRKDQQPITNNTNLFQSNQNNNKQPQIIITPSSTTNGLKSQSLKSTQSTSVGMQSSNVMLSQHASQSNQSSKLFTPNNYYNPNSSSNKQVSNNSVKSSNQSSNKYQGATQHLHFSSKSQNNNNSLSQNLRTSNMEWIDNIQRQLVERQNKKKQQNTTDKNMLSKDSNKSNLNSPIESEKSDRNIANQSPMIKTPAMRMSFNQNGTNEVIDNSAKNNNMLQIQNQKKGSLSNIQQVSSQYFQQKQRPSVEYGNHNQSNHSQYSSVSSTLSSQNRNNLATNYGKIVDSQSDQLNQTLNEKAKFEYLIKERPSDISNQIKSPKNTHGQANNGNGIFQNHYDKDGSLNKLGSPQNIYVQYQYNNFIYSGNQSQQQNLLPGNNFNQSSATGSTNVINTNDQSNILINKLTLESPTQGVYENGNYSQAETPQDLLLSKNLQQHGEYIKIDLLTKMSLETSQSQLNDSSMIKRANQKNANSQNQTYLRQGNHKLNYSNSQKGLDFSKNLSEKVSGFNKHKLVVKQKQKAPAHNNLYDRIILESNKQQQLDSSDARQNSLEKTIGGFFNTLKGNFDGASKFIENMQEKVRKFMPQSPRETKVSSRYFERNSIESSISHNQNQRDSLASIQDKIIQNNISCTSSKYKASRQDAQNTLSQFKTPYKQNSALFNQQNTNDMHQSSLRKKNLDQSYKISSIKPSEKEADDPIEPPSPRGVETICLKCNQQIPQESIQTHQNNCQISNQRTLESSDQRINDKYFLEKIDKLKQALDKYVQDIRVNQPNTRDEIQPGIYIQGDYLACKQLIQNIQFQESSGGASTTMLILIQRLKVLARERLNVIMNYLKDNSIFKLENQSISSGGELNQRQSRQVSEMRNTNGGPKSVRGEMSEEKYKLKQDEVQKTIKEKEFLQKRTADLLTAMQQKPSKKLGLGAGVSTDPNIIHKGQFLISEIKSDVDNQTHVSDNSQKTQTSVFSATTNQKSTVSGIMKEFQTQKDQKMVRSASNNRMGQEGIDEIDETVKFEESKRMKEQKQNTKILFYELCFKIKNNMFPDNHLAKYANIPALYEESQKKSISIAQYQDFIYNELSKNAQLWVSMKEINQIRRKTMGSNSITSNSSQYRQSSASSQSSNHSKDRDGGSSQYQLQESEHQAQIQQNRKSNQPQRNNLFIDSSRKQHGNGSSSHGGSNSKNRLGSGAKIVKIETIMEEDDAQLSMYND